MFRSLLDFISPRACRVCGRRLALSEKEICAVCNWHIPRTHYCDDPYENEMAQLFWGRFPIERAAALMFYQAHSDISRIIYDAKYHGGSDLCQWLGEITAEEFAQKDFFEGIDAIIPVPITLRRRWHRGYNQSEHIARGVSRVTGIPVWKNVLKRVRFVGSQTSLGQMERLQNVVGAFQLKHPDKISHRHLLLIDDVITTGATLGACGEELAKAPGVKISILTIGRSKG